MLRFNNNFFAIATAFFASSLFQPISVFAEEIQEEEFFDDEFEEEVPVKKIEKKTVLENLKESLEIGGNVKGDFSYSGIPSSNVEYKSNDFRPFQFRMLKNIPFSFDAGLKASLSLGKTFKNDAGKNILKVNVSLDFDKYNSDLEEGKTRTFELGSAKGIFFDCFKVGFDREFVTGTKEMLVGGMWKVNDLFTLNFDLMRDLSLVDCKNGFYRRYNEGEKEKDEKGNEKNLTNNYSYNGAIPAFGVQGVFSFGSLGCAKLGSLLRPVLLIDSTNKSEPKSIGLFGFGIKADAEFKFIKDVDKLSVNVLFGSGIGEYNPRMRKFCDGVGFMSGNLLKPVPASFYKEGDDFKSSSFINFNADYSFKVNPQNELSVGAGGLFLVNNFDEKEFMKDQNYLKSLLVGNLGYKFSACKKLDFSVNANLVKVFFNVDSEKIAENLKGEQKDLFRTWGWNLMFGADFKF